MIAVATIGWIRPAVSQGLIVLRFILFFVLFFLLSFLSFLLSLSSIVSTVRPSPWLLPMLSCYQCNKTKVLGRKLKVYSYRK